MNLSPNDGRGEAALDPLHQTALDPEEAWGAQLEVQCACGRKHPLWDKKCPECKTRNFFLGMLKKRKRIERWIDRKIQAEVRTRIEKAYFLLEVAQAYNSALAKVLRQPFPERKKNEDLNRFMKRVAAFFPAMFKSTSPKQMASGLAEEVKRSSLAVANLAWAECQRILGEAVFVPAEALPGRLLERNAERVSSDLMDVTKPYLDALRTLQLAHSRMLTAFGPAQKIFSRDHSTGPGKAIWNKARLMMNPTGRVIHLPTAIWKDDTEQEELKRLDATLSKFMEQAKWFQEQYHKLWDRHNLLLKTYKLSLRKHLVRNLADRAMRASPAQRREMARRFLSKKGVGSALWRWLWGVEK